MTRVPFLDLGRLHASIREELDAAFDRVTTSSEFIGGDEVARFEATFALAHSRRFAAGCASGTDALSLALHAAGIGAGDEVVVPSMTFIATAEAVIHAGAVPTIADVDPDTLLLTPTAVAKVRTPRTKAVIPVDLYGHVVPFDALREWRADSLVVIEDAAQAHLATWQNESVGSAADAACFSFFPGKNLGALGDAGALVTDDERIADEVRRRRDHGRVEKYVHDSIGVSSRLDGLQAAFLSAKLAHLRTWTSARQQLGACYRERLGSGDTKVQLVPWDDGAVHHLLVVRVPAGERDRLRAELSEAGIATGVHYPVPLSCQPSLRPWWRACPAAEAAADEVLSLPMDPLMTEQEVDQVCDRLLTLAR